METRGTEGPRTTPLRCTVRGCARPLRLDVARLVCEARHSYDRARGGWFHLAQPQDARSRQPGDSAESVGARERLLARGLGPAVLEALARLAGDWQGAALDTGCGGGALLARLAAVPQGGGARELYGLDLSAAAVKAAARRRVATILVANADRGLPFADASLALATSVDARRPVDEFARVLRPGGRVIVAVPAAGDLLEVRERVLGRGDALPGGAALEAEFAGRFACVARESVEERALLDAEGLADLAAATYRLSRSRERAALLAAAPLEVVSRHDLRVFELR